MFDGLLRAWGRLMTMIGEPPRADGVAIPIPGISWVPSTISILLPPITGFLFFLVVLLLVISEWPDLRRGLVMTFASRDLRLTVLKILNEIESGARQLSLDRVAHQRWRRHDGWHHLLADRNAERDRIRRAGGDDEFHSDHRTHCDVRYSTCGWSCGRATLLLGLLPAAGFLMVITVEGQFLTSMIIGRHLELNALAVLLSLAFWTWLWGPMGAFLSSPILDGGADPEAAAVC